MKIRIFLVLCATLMLGWNSAFAETGHSQAGLVVSQEANPVYPRRAQTRGIEGYVIVEYTVTSQGAVQNPVVVEAKPPGIFDRSAINALLKVKYDYPGTTHQGVRAKVHMKLSGSYLEFL